MTISERDWNNYVQRLSKLDKRAGDAMEQYITKYGTEDTEGLIVYANALVTRYGEGSAELAAQMYDEMAAAAGVSVPAAEPAEVASPMEVARAVYGTLSSPPSMKGAVSRMVKQAGADTTLKNALRDGAEFAWVPGGMGCAFCLTLASRGWQRASKKAIKGGHAQHIHANCRCSYAIRFDSRTNVAGYDPEKYLRMYENAEGDTPDEKINAMRRGQYAANKDSINDQKRAAYAARKELEDKGTKKITVEGSTGRKKSATMVVDNVISGHSPAPKVSTPNSITDHVGKGGSVETRTFYGNSGFKEKEITNHDHGSPANHPYGEHGEHAHDYEWDEDGRLKTRTTREISEDERKENGDIL